MALTSKPEVGTVVTVSLPVAAIESTRGRYEFPSTLLSQLQGWLSRFKSLEKV